MTLSSARRAARHLLGQGGLFSVGVAERSAERGREQAGPPSGVDDGEAGVAVESPVEQGLDGGGFDGGGTVGVAGDHGEGRRLRGGCRCRG